MKIRTLVDLNQALSDDLSWRKKELSYLLLMVDKNRANTINLQYLIRSGIAMLYAHWEGFVKAGAQMYIDYINYKRLRYNELSPNFVAINMKGKLDAATQSNKARLHIEIAELFLTSLTSQCNLSSSVIRTKGNLNSDILKDIHFMLGLDYAIFETKSNFIDISLLQRRNSIAHGEYLNIDYARFKELHSITIEILELFRNQIENAASTKIYLQRNAG
jgi:hypothetical protein